MTNDFEKVFDTAAEPQDLPTAKCGNGLLPMTTANAPKWEWRTAMWSVGSR